MARLFRRIRRHETGATITEVALMTLILAVVMLLAFNFLDRASLLTARSDANGRTEMAMQDAMRAVTQNVRGAKPIVSMCSATTDTPPADQSAFTAGYANCIVVRVPKTESAADQCAATNYAYGFVTRTSDGVRLLVENAQPVTQSGTTCVSGTWRGRRVLLERVANAATEPLFTYFSSTGAVIPATDTVNVPKANAVRVTLVASYSANTPNQVLVSTAALRNNVTR